MDLLKKLKRIETLLGDVAARFEDPGFNAETDLIDEAADRVEEVRKRLQGLLKPEVCA